MKLTLIRLAKQSDAIFGTLLVNDVPLFATLELPWRENATNGSCIPMGTYKVKPVNSPKFGNVFEVCDVPNRSHILLHKGNTAKDTHGCILIGSRCQVVESTSSVLESTKAMESLSKLLANKTDIEMQIKQIYL